MKAQATLYCCLFILWCKLVLLHGTATLEFEMIMYNNSEARTANNGPCEAYWKAAGECDHVFTFCVKRYPSGSIIEECFCDLFYNQTGVLLGNATSKFGENHNDVINVFSDNIAGMPNPLAIGNITWDGKVDFRIAIDEDDIYSLSDHIDDMYEVIDFSPAPDEDSSVWINVTYYGLRELQTSTLHARLRTYCDPGYYGPHCNCQPVNSSSQGHYSCDRIKGKVCLPGWENPYTDCLTSIDDCVSDPCSGGSTCLDGHMTVTCLCAPGYTGVRCDEEIDECLPCPCQHEALCTDQHNGYRCQCSQEYSGNNCQYSKCEQCSDHGTCDPKSGQCNCRLGYGGPYCGTFLCDVISCLNGGCCFEGKCNCAAGFTGAHCELSLCNFTNCFNGGTCDRLTGACFNCNPFYTGSYCEVEICGCDLTCGQHGVCDQGVCKCLHGYTGSNCQSQVVLWHTPVIVTVMVSAIVMGLVISMFVIVNKRLKH